MPACGVDWTRGRVQHAAAVEAAHNSLDVSVALIPHNRARKAVRLLASAQLAGSSQLPLRAP